MTRVTRPGHTAVQRRQDGIPGVYAARSPGGPGSLNVEGGPSARGRVDRARPRFRVVDEALEGFDTAGYLLRSGLTKREVRALRARLLA